MSTTRKDTCPMRVPMQRKSQFVVTLQDTETNLEDSTEMEQGPDPWMRIVTVSKEDSEE